MTDQFQDVYSDGNGKRVVKLLSGTLFLARKYLRLNSEQRIYASQLFLNRISNKFCNIKGSFDCFVTTNQEDILIANAPFFQHMSLLDYISMEKQPGHFTKIFEALILTMLLGQNEYFYSYENIFINRFIGQIVLPPFSVVGLIPLNFRTKFSRQQFMEIYQLLDYSMFEPRPEKSLIQISHKMKFRALGMMVIHCIIQKRISLIQQEDITTDTISFEDAGALVRKLKQRFTKLLTVRRAIQLFTEASNRDKIDYYYFVKRVFIDQCEGMTWKQVKQLLIPKRNSPGSDLDQYFKEVAQLKYQQQDDFTKRRLQSLGILQSEPQIYLSYKLDIPRLTFSKLSDLIQREKYASSYNWKMMISLAKLLPQQQESEQQEHIKAQTSPQQQARLSQAINKIVEKMGKHYKTNAAEIRGTKIYALDPKISIVNQYFRL